MAAAAAVAAVAVAAVVGVAAAAAAVAAAAAAAAGAAGAAVAAEDSTCYFETKWTFSHFFTGKIQTSKKSNGLQMGSKWAPTAQVVDCDAKDQKSPVSMIGSHC